MGERTSHAPGTFSWVDLSTTDPGAAKGFYGDLFGWEFDDLPVGDGQNRTRTGRVVITPSPLCWSASPRLRS